MLNEVVLPWFAAQKVEMLRILTDRGTEFCGKIEEHAYEFFLAVEDIDHTKTKARSPQTNGICERFHETMKSELYDTLLCKKLYHSLEASEQDVDAWSSLPDVSRRDRVVCFIRQRDCQISRQMSDEV